MKKIFEYDEVPAVSTKAGKVKGYKWNDINIFKGIPYAQAKRFQMPYDVEPWDGIKDATSYGFVCPLLNKETPLGELLVPHRYWPQDENCLNLNVWTPSLDSKAKKPVMVWFHGGGYTAGSSIEQEAYDGHNLSEQGDIVVVSVNHRLNILGFLDLSPFGDKYKNSGNAGLVDLVASLKWIKENILEFGGDPDNVTIFGQSGGGMKVTGLMQIPEADGLFHKAIVMSGVADGKLLVSPEGDGTDIVNALLEELKIPVTEIEKLETVPYHDFANAYNKVFMGLAQTGKYVGCSPIVNDYYIGEPVLVGFREHAKKIPLLVGSVYGEFAFAPLGFNKYDAPQEKLDALFAKKYGEHAGRVIELFKKAYPDKVLGDLVAFDRIFRSPSKKLAELHATDSKSKAYLYNFTLDFPYQNGKIAWHCADIPFVFKNTDRVAICNIPGITEKLESQVSNAFVEFAKKGDPNHEGLPKWDPVTPDCEPTMIFDKVCEVRNNYDDELLNTIEEVSPPFNLAELFSGDVQH